MLSSQDVKYLYPFILLIVLSVVTLFLDLFTKQNKKIVSGFSMLTIAAVIASLFYILINDPEIARTQEILHSYLRINRYTIAFSVLSMLGIFITFLASKNYLKKHDINFGEFYYIILFSAAGMLTMLYANDLLVIFIGLELMSVSFYILAGLMRRRLKSNESALKYFLLGAFITGFILLGISLMYGTGLTKGIENPLNLTAIKSNPNFLFNPYFLVGFALFLIGFFFKIGLFPFQMWIPDVYDGAPTVVSGMMSTSGKIAAAGTLAPIIIIMHPSDLTLMFSVIAVLTMVIGNVVALVQNNLKRLLAYSSIASAGYLLVGITSMNIHTLDAVTFYLLAYTFMQLGSFLIVSHFEGKTADGKDFSNIDIGYYKGLAKRSPVFTVIFTIYLFSLAGIPPLAGFWGKYYLFYAAIKANLIWLSVVAILMSVVSVYYYLRIIVYMWFMDSKTEIPEEKNYLKGNMLFFAANVVCVLGTLVFGFYPQLLFEMFKLIQKII